MNIIDIFPYFGLLLYIILMGILLVSDKHKVDPDPRAATHQRWFADRQLIPKADKPVTDVHHHYDPMVFPGDIP